MTENTEVLHKLPQVRGEYRFSEPLDKHTWLKVGGPAEIMFIPQDKKDLQYFLQHKPSDYPVFMLGGGSNVLVRDGGIRGIVIKLQNDSFKTVKIEDGQICCGAGLLNANLKKIVIENGLGGLEFLCSIPGSIGGMFRSNAGCFGSDLSKVLKKAVVVDTQGNMFEVKNEDFHFGYRHSDFPTDWIVVEAYLQFEKSTSENVSQKIKDNDEYRREHQPQGIRTAGSTFKNPVGYRAWELIKNAGGSDITVGGAKMSSQHCNFLQTDKTATAADIEKLGEKIITAVKKQANVNLEWELTIVGQEQKSGR